MRARLLKRCRESGEDFQFLLQRYAGERFLYRLFNTVGETLPSMALARQAVSLAKGRSQASVADAADSVADELCAMVQPFAEAAFA